MKTGQTILNIVVAVFMIGAAVKINSQSKAIENLTNQHDLMNVRVNSLERVTKFLFDQEQEQTEKRVTIRTRFILP